MPKTQLGLKVERWSAGDKTQLKNDLDMLAKLPLDVLRSVVDKIAKTHPACNPIELAALEAEQSSIPDPHALSDAISSFPYILENITDESPQAVSADLASLGLLSDDAARILTDLLVSAEPFRETARVAASYLRIGSALFVGIRGTVDLRLRFHKTEAEFSSVKHLTALFGSQLVIMADLTISRTGGKETSVSFLMDENDLRYMKRFVKNMERELDMGKNLLESAEHRGNG